MMKFRNTLYSPDGTGASNNVVEFVFQGEKMELDLTKPEDKETAKALMEKGKLYDKKMHEMSEKEKKAELFDQFTQTMQAIKAGEADPEIFIKVIENETGLKLSMAEKEQIREGDLFEEGDALIGKLHKKISELEEKINKTQADAMISAKEETAHSKLEVKYDGSDGMPKYDRAEIEKWCQEQGFFMADIEKQYEQAYKMMNYDKIALIEQQKKIDKKSNLQQKRDHDKIETGSGTRTFKEKSIDVKGKTYDDLVDEILNKAREEGTPIFIDD